MSGKVVLDCVRFGQFGSGQFSEKFKQERKITIEQDENVAQHIFFVTNLHYILNC